MADENRCPECAGGGHAEGELPVVHVPMMTRPPAIGEQATPLGSAKPFERLARAEGALPVIHVPVMTRPPAIVEQATTLGPAKPFERLARELPLPAMDRVRESRLPISAALTGPSWLAESVITSGPLAGLTLTGLGIAPVSDFQQSVDLKDLLKRKKELEDIAEKLRKAAEEYGKDPTDAKSSDLTLASDAFKKAKADMNKDFPGWEDPCKYPGKLLYTVSRAGITYEVYERCIKYSWVTSQGGRVNVAVPVVPTPDWFKGMICMQAVQTAIEDNNFLSGGVRLFIIVPGCTTLAFQQLARCCRKHWLAGDAEPACDYTSPVLGLDISDNPVYSPQDADHWAIDTLATITADQIRNNAPPPYYPFTLTDSGSVIGMRDLPREYYDKQPTGQRRNVNLKTVWEFCTIIWCDGKILGVVSWGFTEEATKNPQGVLINYKVTNDHATMSAPSDQEGAGCIQRFNALENGAKNEVGKVTKKSP